MKGLVVNVFLAAVLLLAPSKAALSDDEASEPKVSQASEVIEVLTCDGFAACPQGESLVASPALVECGQRCSVQACCSSDTPLQVLDAQGRRLDSQNETNTTTGTSTTTTMAPPASNQATVITGSFTLRVTSSNFQTMLNDPLAILSIKKMIQGIVNVPLAWLSVSFDIVQGGARRLRNQAIVKAKYTINIPSPDVESSNIDAASVLNAFSEQDSSSLVTLLTASFDQTAGTGRYSLVLESFSTPVHVYVDQSPGANDGNNPTTTEQYFYGIYDSLAPTQVAFTLAHTLALAVAIAAWSS